MADQATLNSFSVSFGGTFNDTDPAALRSFSVEFGPAPTTSRPLTAAVQAQIEAAAVRPVLLAKISTLGGDANFWTGIGDLDWSGDTYAGAGDLAGISEVEETADIQATGLVLSLSGVNSANLSIALGQISQGLPVKVWLAFLDSDLAIVADPVLVWEGLADVPEVVESGDAATISLSSESRLVDLQRPRIRRYTQQDQQQDDATDVGFEFVPSLQDKRIIWGG